MRTRCPICQRVVTWGEAPRPPFCSERCRLADLGAWLGERYEVPGVESDNPPGLPDPGGVTDDGGGDEESR